MDKTTERIKADAEAKYPLVASHTITDGPRAGYIAGATAENERAFEMYKLLVLLRQYHYEAREGRELNHDAIIGKIETHLQQWKGEKELLKCPCCKGDGRETCTNPDHGFIEAMPGEIGRLGCPVCGHDPNHKVKNGGQCEVCNGTGKVNKDQFNQFCTDTGYDNEPEPITNPTK